MARRVLLTIAAALVVAAPTAYACFSPTDFFASEVLLNKPAVKFDLAVLREADNVLVKNGALIYQSHAEAQVAVILDEQSNVMLWEDKDRVSGLDVRLQIPTKTVDAENGPDLAPAVDVDPDTFDFSRAMEVELEWLRRSGIVAGLDDQDVAVIASLSGARVAGWNSRLVYHAERWFPFAETGGAMLLRDGGGCGGFDVENVPAGIVVLDATAVDPAGKLAITWGSLKATR